MAKITNLGSSGCLDIRDVFRQRLPFESTGTELMAKGSCGVQAGVHSSGRSALVYKELGMKPSHLHSMEQTTASLPPFWPPSPYRVSPPPVNVDANVVMACVQSEKSGMKQIRSQGTKHTTISLPPFWPACPPRPPSVKEDNSVVAMAEKEDKTVEEETSEADENTEVEEEYEDEEDEEDQDSEEEVEEEGSDESEQVPRELAGFVQHVEMQMDESEENDRTEESSAFSETSSGSSQYEQGRRGFGNGYHAKGINAMMPRQSGAEVPNRNHSGNLQARANASMESSDRAFSGEVRRLKQIPAVPAPGVGGLAAAGGGGGGGVGLTLSQQKLDALKYLRMLDAGGLAAVRQVNQEVTQGGGSERRARSGPLTWRGTPENSGRNVAWDSTEEVCLCASASGQVAMKCHQHSVPAKLGAGGVSRATQESRNFEKAQSWSSVQIGSDGGGEKESWAQIRARQRFESAERRVSLEESSEGEGMLSLSVRRASLTQPVELNRRHRPTASVTGYSLGFKDAWETSPLAAPTPSQLHCSPSPIRSRGRSLTYSKSERDLWWLDMDAGEVVSQRSGLLSPSMELRAREASPSRYLSQPTSPAQLGGQRSMSMGGSRPASPSLRNSSTAPQLFAFQRQHSRRTAASLAGLISPEPTLPSPILRTPPHNSSRDYYSSASKPKAPIFDTWGPASEETPVPSGPISPAVPTIVMGIPVAMMGQSAPQNLSMCVGHPVANAVANRGEERIDHPSSAATGEESEVKKMVYQTANGSGSGVRKGSERASRGGGKSRGGKLRRVSRAKVTIKATKPFELTAWVQKLLDEAINAGPAPTPAPVEAAVRQFGAHVTESEGKAAMKDMVEVEEVKEVHSGGVMEMAEMGMGVGGREVGEADGFSFACSGGVPALLVQPPVEDEEEEEDVKKVEMEMEEEVGVEVDEEEKAGNEVEIDVTPLVAEPDWVESEEEGSRRGVGVGDVGEGNEAGLPKGVSAEEGLAHSLAFLANLTGGGLGTGAVQGFGLPPKPRSPPSKPQDVAVRDEGIHGEETEFGMETETKEEEAPERHVVRPPVVAVASQKIRHMAMIYEGAQEEVRV